MKLVITHGCSFTKYRWSCWPNFLSWFDKDINVKNYGFPASGNEAIARGVVNSVLKYKNIHKIYIMWSGSDRYEVVRDPTALERTKADYTDGYPTYCRFDPDFNWCIWFGGHPDSKHHEYYQKHFLNEGNNWFKTLERILYTQMFLDKNKIDYTMMIFKADVLRHEKLSNAEQALYKQIDWTKFKFYKEKLGLFEFARELYSKYFIVGNGHPLPFTHYKWVKDIMFESDIEPPKKEYIKLEKYGRP